MGTQFALGPFLNYRGRGRVFKFIYCQGIRLGALRQYKGGGQDVEVV